MDKLIITAALTGSVPTKAHNPHLPVTPDEIAADGLECVKAGASILHIHVRDEKGVNAMNKGHLRGGRGQDPREGGRGRS